MPENPKKLLADVLEAVRRIQAHCGGKTRDDYLGDEVLRGFVERKLLIVGEALARLRQSHPEAAVMLSPPKRRQRRLARLRQSHPEAAEKITDIHRIIGQRNRIVHGYDAGDDLLIWDAIQNHLPMLLAQVEELLGGEG